MKNINYVVITPVRDEEAYIGLTISSMVGQTIVPSRWVIVDDGSTDQTPEIIDEASRIHPWISVMHRTNRGFRKSGGGVVEGFNSGFIRVDAEPWEYLVKLDGDLSFGKEYFEQCFELFDRDPRLGLGGGTICAEHDGVLTVDSEGDPPFHVRGATKIYRRACWEQIGPLEVSTGWDTIDEVKANMLGWSTRTFPDLKLVQHKPTGSADGHWRNWYKNGRGSFVTGYHPLFMAAKCAKRALKKPYLTASCALFAGFLSGYLKNIKPVQDRRVIAYLRQQQLRRLMLKDSIYGRR